MRIGNDDTDAKRSESMYQLGRYYDRQGRLSAAETSYRKSIALDSENAEARNALGALLAGQGRLDEAIENLKAAVLLAPTRAHILNNLGYAYILDKNYSKAVFWLNEAVLADPKYRRAAHNLDLARQGAQQLAQVSGELKVLKIETALGQSMAETAPSTVPGNRLDSANPAPDSSAAGMELAAVSSPGAGWNIRLDTVLRSSGNVSLGVGEGQTRDQGEAGRNYLLEISNGMGRPGAARRLGALLHREGAPFAYLTDLKPFNQKQTEVEFSKGYQADAALLAQRIGANTVQVNTLYRDRRVHVRIRVGKDINSVI